MMPMQMQCIRTFTRFTICRIPKRQKAEPSGLHVDYMYVPFTNRTEGEGEGFGLYLLL